MWNNLTTYFTENLYIFFLVIPKKHIKLFNLAFIIKKVPENEPEKKVTM